MGMVLQHLDGLVGAVRRLVDHRQRYVVAVAALIGDGEVVPVDLEMRPFGEALEGAGHRIAVVIGDDLEGGATWRIDEADHLAIADGEGGVEDGVADVDRALDRHLVVAAQGGYVADAGLAGLGAGNLDHEAGVGAEGEVAGVQDTGAGAGRQGAVAVDLGDPDLAVATERAAGLDGGGCLVDVAVDLEEAGFDSGGALEVGVVARDDQGALARLGQRALAGDGVVLGDRLAVAVGDGERRRGAVPLQEHHLAWAWPSVAPPV